MGITRMPTEQQDINNAQQGKNDAQQNRNNAEQSRNNAEQVGQPTAQGITNSDQHDTNSAQKRTNAAQGVTNTEQGVTNSDQRNTNTEQCTTNDAQGATNIAQGATNIAQGVTNGEMQGQLNTLRASSTTMHDIITALTESLRVNTSSMLSVSDDLKKNLAVYEKIDLRIDKVEERARKVEEHAVNIERMSNRRAKVFRRLWKWAIVIAVAVSLLLSSAFYALNSSLVQKNCEARNANRMVVTNLIQQFDDVTKSLPGADGNPYLAIENRYLQEVPPPSTCGLLP